MAIDMRKFTLRFVDESREHLQRLNQGLEQLASAGQSEENINALFRAAHTIKGSARMLRLGSINDLAHAAEDLLAGLRDRSLVYEPALAQLLQQATDHIAALVDLLAANPDGAALPATDQALLAALKKAASPADQAALEPSEAPPAPAPQAAASADEPAVLRTADSIRIRLEQLDSLVMLMGEVVSSHALLRQRVDQAQQLARGRDAGLRQFVRELNDDVLSQETLMSGLHDRVLQLRMLPLALVMEPAARLAREIAHSVGKRVQCRMSGAQIELDRQMIDLLTEPLLHLIRNAVDHGIESPEQRAACGKPASGSLQLSARQEGRWIVLELCDDGAGIDVAAVRAKAVNKALVSAEKAALMSDQELTELIFLPGFSTSEIISDLSGRGVGMDVVKRCVLDDLQGFVSVHSQLGQGSRFTLKLPLSLAVMRVLIVAAGAHSFAFTAQYVVELLRVPQSALLQVAARDAVIVRNEFVPVADLQEILQLGSGAPRQSDDVLLVVLQVHNEKLALRVDELIDERDLIIKQLPEHMRANNLVAGMVQASGNALVSVLQAPALLDRANHRQAARPSAQQQADTRAHRVLVVDDSLNTREIEKDVLQAHGYQVVLAEDGRDGLEKALAQNFDAILTDVEMPHMDGFTLTQKLRTQEKYAHTPIIIISSREKEQDKRRGIQVGADAYIVKGDFDQSNLVSTLRALLP